jgi:type IV pilus assembly protein PilY1
MRENNLIRLSLPIVLNTLICSNLYAAPKINPSNVPLETGIVSLVKPNLMFIFDESSSMGREYLGDEIGGMNCKFADAGTPDSLQGTNWAYKQPKIQYQTQADCLANMPATGTKAGENAYYCGWDAVTSSQCLAYGDNGCTSWSQGSQIWNVRQGTLVVVPGTPKGTPYYFSRPCFNSYNNITTSPVKAITNVIVPFAAYEFNKIYYNPNVVYKPAVDYLGNSMGDQSITSARVDIYSDNSVINLLTQAKENYWCTRYPSTADLADKNICKRNGIDTPNPFNYVTEAYPKGDFVYSGLGATTLFYYEMIPIEYCDAKGINCAFIQNETYPVPFPIRWCNNTTNAISPNIVTGAGKCQANYSTAYPFPRYGNFKRVDVPSSQYTNYANWFTYYRNRLSALKTAAGLAFASIDKNKRVGFLSLNTPSSFLPVADFDNGVGSGTTSTPQKSLFYSKLYGLTATGDTDLKKTLSQIGKYYAGISSGISAGMINGTTSKDPVQYSCQQNFALLATDGYWNPGTYGKDLNNNNVGNVDNVNNSSNYSLRIDGVYDGGLASSSDTLSDVALYYYKTPLRSATLGNCISTSSGLPQDLCQSNVPTTALDQNPNQHMVTYAMSLGINGVMNYTKDYTYGTSTDLQNIKNGAIGACPWISGSTGVCNWPVPVGNDPTALDDLWHATISGRGKYFSAKDSNDMISSLQDALTSVSAQTGSSAAAATSSPNITATDNSLFYVTYRTMKWDGEINATTIDSTTGVIGSTQKWSARALLNSKVGSTTDTRTIYYVRNGSGSSALRTFVESNMTSSEFDNFRNKCSNNLLSQCVNLSSPNKAIIDNGSALVTYLRGQSKYDVNNSASPLFRPREYVLGDIVNSSPVYLSKPTYAWTDSGYAKYVTDNATRAATLYVGANDGMIHAFDATTGQEKWAVIPSQMMNKLYKLADTTYATTHDFFVDGTISVMDAKIGNSWKTVLITGMNSGGKGYIALDITDPANPKALWEICTSSICSVTDSDLGYSYGNPIITKRKFDGKWVAYLSAGYDNISAKGLIYEVDLESGSVLRKLTTGTGNPGVAGVGYSQSGIAKINAYYSNFNQDNTALYLYAGDLDGKIWKWDLSDSSKTDATLLGQATDPSNVSQPITTKIELGRVNGNIVLLFGTGKFLSNTDYTTTQQQSVYAIRDSNKSLGILRNNSSIVKQTITPSSLTATSSNNTVDFSVNNGWYFDLNVQTGERVNLDPTLSLGVLNLVSNIPGTSSCTAGGNAWMYQIDFATGSAVDQVNGFIAKKMPSGLVVGQSIVQLGQVGGLKNYVTDANGQVIMVSVPTGKTSATNKIKKYYWKEINKK